MNDGDDDPLDIRALFEVEWCPSPPSSPSSSSSSSPAPAPSFARTTTKKSGREMRRILKNRRTAKTSRERQYAHRARLEVELAQLREEETDLEHVRLVAMGMRDAYMNELTAMKALVRTIKQKGQEEEEDYVLL